MKGNTLVPIVDTQRYWVMRGIAAALGVRIKWPFWLRFGVMTIPFILVILIASYLKEMQPLLAAGALLFGYFIVFLIVYYWRLEERRNRDIVNGAPGLQPDDGPNSEFRQEALFACAWLFVLTPLMLQTLNPVALHLAVSSWSDARGDLAQIVELPQWLIYSAIACLNTLPVMEHLFPDAQTNLAGISETSATPQVLAPALEALFAVFLFSLVVQQAGQARRRVTEAVEALGSTFVFAAALGPRVLTALMEDIEHQQGTRFRNGVLALSEIALRYTQVRKRIRTEAGPLLNEQLNAVRRKTTDGGERLKMAALARALCLIGDPGIRPNVVDRILEPYGPSGESYANRGILVDALAAGRATDFLTELHTTLVARGHKLAGRVNQHLNPDADDGSEAPHQLATAA